MYIYLHTFIEFVLHYQCNFVISWFVNLVEGSVWCVVVSCSVLQRVTVCCSVLQWVRCVACVLHCVVFPHYPRNFVMSVCIHTNIYIYIYNHMYIHIYIYTYINIYIHTYVHTYIYNQYLITHATSSSVGSWPSLRSFKNDFSCMCVSCDIDIYIHIYIYIYIHVLGGSLFKKNLWKTCLFCNLVRCPRGDPSKRLWAAFVRFVWVCQCEKLTTYAQHWVDELLATHCNTLQHDIRTALSGWITCNTLQHTAIRHTHSTEWMSYLQHTATHCNTLQHTATHCNTSSVYFNVSSCATCDALQHNTLQHAATQTHCNTLQHEQYVLQRE